MPRMTEKISMWFDYPDDPDQGRVEIQNLDDGDIAAISAKAFSARLVYDAKADKPVQEKIYNELVDRQETAARVVKNWENFFGADGEQMPCTDDAKRKWACSNAFMAFINRSRSIVEEAAKKQADERRKN